MEENQIKDGPAKATLADLRESALKHYEEISRKAHHWSSFVEHAIEAYDPDRLKLPLFRELNVHRAEHEFKCYTNQPITYWTTAIAGEVGELCNMIKKIQRVAGGGVDGGTSYKASDINKEKLQEEIGGIAIYLDLMSSLLGISLEDAIIQTFNAKSKELNFKTFYPDAQF